MNNESIHQQEMICALATAVGVGAIAVVRLSGKGSIHLVNQFFKGSDLEKAETHTVHFGTIRENGKVIDEVLVSVFHTPNSFTKEDAIEISCHGSSYIVRQILKLLITNGARIAKPGEFTQRAFLNGQFDLVQAEAVADLIAADSEASHKTALNQLRGGFSKKLDSLRTELIHFASLIELELDFGEEDVEFAERDDLRKLINTLLSTVGPLIESFDFGNAIKEGFPVAIIGSPNVGKSTLLNALLNEERAIVTSIAGTTRDVIEDTIVIGGLKFRFIDTAGIRETTDIVESIGIERSKQAMEKADVIIFLFDSDETFQELQVLANSIGKDKKVLWVRNKVDMEVNLTPRPPLLQVEGVADAIHSVHPGGRETDAIHSVHSGGKETDAVHSADSGEGETYAIHSVHSGGKETDAVNSADSGEGEVDSVYSVHSEKGEANAKPPSPQRRGAGGEVLNTTYKFLTTKIPPEVLENARNLRQEATTAENYLWAVLRNRQFENLKFRRQHPLEEGFILDFFCAELRLGIELDGEVHLEREQEMFDIERSKRIEEIYGIEILRFSNMQVFNQIETIFMEIVKFVLNKKAMKDEDSLLKHAHYDLTPRPPLLEGEEENDGIHLVHSGEREDDAIHVAHSEKGEANSEPPSPQRRGAGGEVLNPINIAAKTQLGLPELTSKLIALVQNQAASDTVVSNSRHYEHLLKTKNALADVLYGLDNGITGDFLAQDIRLSLHHLGEITGTIVTDDLLDNIFSKFCIGK